MTSTTQPIYVEIYDRLGSIHDVTADVMSIRADIGGVRNLAQVSQPGTLDLVLNNVTKTYTPPPTTPAVTDYISARRPLRCRYAGSQLGYCARLYSSGYGGAGGSVNTNTGNVAQIAPGTGGAPHRWAQAILSPGGTVASFIFQLAANTGAPTMTMDWYILSDNLGAPGATLANGTLTATASASNTVSPNNTTFIPAGTLVWIALDSTNAVGGASINIQATNTTDTYPSGVLYATTDSGTTWTVDATNVDMQLAVTFAPVGEQLAQTVTVGVANNDVFLLSFQARAQFDSQLNTLVAGVTSSAESPAPTAKILTNKWASYSVSWTATTTGTTVTAKFIAGLNIGYINSAYIEVRNATLTKNAGANLLVNGDFSTSSGSLSSWTETARSEIALYSAVLDTWQNLRLAAGAGGTTTITATGATATIGASGSAVAQTFQVGGTGTFSQFGFDLSASTGSPTGKIGWQIYTDNGLRPATLLMAGSVVPLVPSAGMTTMTNTVKFNGGPYLIAATTYWLVLYSHDTQTAGNNWNVTASAASTYANGAIQTTPSTPAGYVFNNPFVAWTAGSGDMQSSYVTVANSTIDKFAIPFRTFTSVSCNGADLFLQRVGAAAGTMTLRIETDSSGSPSGNLVHANATGTAAEGSGKGTGGGWTAFSYTSFTLPAGVYWLVLSTDRAASSANYMQLASNANGTQSAAGYILASISSAYSVIAASALFDVKMVSITAASAQPDTYTIFDGVIDDITPSPHQLAGDYKLSIKAKTWEVNLATQNFIGTVQTAQTEAQLIAYALGQLPSGTLTTTYRGKQLDTGRTMIPIAFDGYTKHQTKILQAVQDCTQSGFGMFFADFDGTYRYLNVNWYPTRQSVAAALTITEGITTPGSPIQMTVRNQFSAITNHVLLTVHPRGVDIANTILAQLQYGGSTGTPPQIPGRTNSGGILIPGKLTLTLNYHDTAGKAIGVLSVVNPPVAYTDYVFQWWWGGSVSQAGLITDLTTRTDSVNFSLDTTQSPSQAVVTFTNNNPFPVYVSRFQVKGIGIYQYDPKIVESSDLTTLGYGALGVGGYSIDHKQDLPFTADDVLAQGIADYMVLRYKNAYTGIDTLSFRNRAALGSVDLASIQMFDQVVAPDAQSGITSGMPHFVVGVSWTASVAAGLATFSEYNFALERADPNKYAKYDDTTYGRYNTGGGYYI